MTKTLLLLGILCSLCSGCVDQHAEEASVEMTSGSGKSTQKDVLKEGDTLKSDTEIRYGASVMAAREKVAAMGTAPRIIATSPATADICDRLGLDLAGICSSSVSALPDRYQGLPKVGTAMAPDMEQIKALAPDWILSPSSLQSDLQPKYENIGSDWAFLNLSSVTGMYRSILELGEIFGKEQEAQEMMGEFTTYYTEYQERMKNKKHPRVLILMGLPGSYLIATKASYAGNLVELAGGENVYTDTSQAFLTVNTEDMKTKEPDIILRTAHALEDQVEEMFQKEFAENDIWSHFEAVEQGRVYDLDYEKFGMSANLQYQDALDSLQKMFYEK